MAFIALLFTSTAVLAMGKGLGFLVDEGLSKGNTHLLNQAFMLMGGVVLLLSVATYFRFSLVTWLGEKVVADIRRDVFERIISMHTSFFETTRTGDILSRLTTDTAVLQGVIGSSISVAIRNSLLIFGALSMLLVTSAKLTLYVAVIVPLVVVPIITLGRRVRILSRATQDRLADLSSRAEESVSGIRTIQALSLELIEQSRFFEHQEQLLSTAKERINKRALLTAIVIVLVFGAIITVLWIGGHDVLAGTLSGGALSSFVFYSMVLAGGVGAISEVMGDLQRAAGASERLAELLSLESEIKVSAHPLPLPSPVQGEIHFEQVSFNYPSRPDRRALNNFSLTVKPGQTVALVGASGAGKSTIFQLLMRFYDPANGQICVDNIPIQQFNPRELRQVIGLVPQDTVIFSTNAWENIRCGNPDATDEEILAAAEAAAARDFLEKLPDGFNSFLGEKGVRLSGGQRQRLAIARAIIRNPRILLLDEATNALDAESEYLVQQAITHLMQGRTTLVIAHRLATVLHADVIIVMDNGQMVARGTHTELLTSSPHYARLVDLQFSKK